VPVSRRSGRDQDGDLRRALARAHRSV